MSLKICSLIFSSIFLMGMSTPPPPPPAGIVERQIETEYEAKKIEPEKEVPLLEMDLPEKQLDLEGEAVRINHIDFGQNILSPSEVEKIVRPYMGRDLSMQEMKRLCADLQAAYAKKGYFLARCYLPEQEIRHETLQVGVLEGKLGEVTVVGNKHYSTEFIQSYFSKLEGKPINYDQFLKVLFLLNENSDLDAGAVFKKGKTFGTADVVIQVHDKRPVHLFVDHNNYGSLHTSRHRTGGRLDWGSIFLCGDTLSVAEVLGSPIEKLDFTDIIYRVPLNTYGSRLEFSYLIANFKTDTIDNEFIMKGRSHIASAKFTQALNRTRHLNTDIFTSFDYKQIKNYSEVGTTSYDKLRVVALGIDIDYIDRWKGRNLVTAAGYVGIPDLFGGLNPVDQESSRVGAGGRFVKLNGGVKRIQKLPKDCFLLLNGFGQYSFNKLALPEQLYIGGVDTVRGYKLAVGLGDSGYYGNVELRVPLPFIRTYKIPFSKKKTWGEFFQIVGFLDFGETFNHGKEVLRETEVGINGQPTKGDVPQSSRTILTAAGCGARVYGPWKLEFSLDAGFPLTSKHRSSDTIVYFKVAWQIL